MTNLYRVYTVHAGMKRAITVQENSSAAGEENEERYKKKKTSQKKSSMTIRCLMVAS